MLTPRLPNMFIGFPSHPQHFIAFFDFFLWNFLLLSPGILRSQFSHVIHLIRSLLDVQSIAGVMINEFEHNVRQITVREINKWWIYGGVSFMLRWNSLRLANERLSQAEFEFLTTVKFTLTRAFLPYTFKFFIFPIAIHHKIIAILSQLIRHTKRHAIYHNNAFLSWNMSSIMSFKWL